MNFLKQNAFMVAVVAVFLVVLIIQIVIIAGDDLQAKQIAPRQALDSQMKSLQGAGLVSDTHKEELKKVADALKADTEQVAQQVSTWTNKYPVMMISSKVPAFPWESNYRQRGYTSIIVTTYENSLGNLRTQLGEVKLCSEEEIYNLEQEELEKLNEMEQERLRKEAEEAERAATPRAGSRATPAPFLPRTGSGLMGSRMQAAGPGVAGAPNIQAQAREYAEARISIKQASQGAMFVDPNALHKRELDRNREDAKGLWDAQLNLWIQKDIVLAIQKTNAQAFGSAKPSVVGAWVKRLKSIVVTPGYAISQPTGAAPGAVGAPAAPRPGAMAAGPSRMGAPSMMGRGFTPRAAAAPTVTADPKAASFTNHGSNKEYDVVRYSFTVVMSPRHLLALEKNLLNQNLHTVLNVTISPLSDTHPQAEARAVRAGGLGAGSGPSGLAPYYYGPDAVAEVRIEGELLLVAERTRGSKYNVQTKAWEIAPLVPVETLKALPAEALRSEDQARVAASEAPGLPAARYPTR